MEKITEDKVLGLVDIYTQKGTGLDTSTNPVDRSKIASYIFSTILKETNRILGTVNNLIDKINGSEYYVEKLYRVDKDTIIDDVIVKFKKEDMFIGAGDIVCYCDPDTRELVNIRVFFRIDKDPKNKYKFVELNSDNLFKNKEDCIEAITKEVKENINKKYEKLIDNDYSYFLKNNSIIK